MELNASKYPTLTIDYYNGMVKKVRCIKVVRNIRDKELYYETTRDLCMGGTVEKLSQIRQWQVTI